MQSYEQVGQVAVQVVWTAKIILNLAHLPANDSVQQYNLLE